LSKFQSIKLISQPELCDALGVSRYTLERWTRQGRFPKPIKLTEKTVTWKVSDIEAWLAQRSRSRKRAKKRGALMEGNELVKR